MSCTIIIPTYNRPECLSRILDYYAKSAIEWPIVVADSSTEENKKANKDIIASLPSLNISYVEHHDELPVAVPVRKLANALGHVGTKFCLVCADDDFITPKGIREAVDFLEQNPDYAVAHGRVVGFYLKSGSGGTKEFFWQTRYSNHSITFPDAPSRLISHMSNYRRPTFYSVHETNLARRIYEESPNYLEVDGARFGEFLPSALALVHGKMKCLDVFYGARELVPVPKGETRKSVKSMKDFMDEGTYDSKYEKFRECVSIHLMEETDLDIEGAKQVVDQAMDAFLQRFIFKDYKSLAKNEKLDVVLRHLPGWVGKGIRWSYRALFVNKKFSDPTREYHEDLDQIRAHVLAHAETGQIANIKSGRS